VPCARTAPDLEDADVRLHGKRIHDPGRRGDRLSGMGGGAGLDRPGAANACARTRASPQGLPY